VTGDMFNLAVVVLSTLVLCWADGAPRPPADA
jgi:hypothetical protein